RYFIPGDPEVMLFFEAGDKDFTGADKVHQGPYVKYQVQGLGKDGAVRVPLSGNPNPSLGGRVPTSTAERVADFLSKVRKQ
ncbi:hypothetical protein, partial [Streptomyces sp. NPDC059389]|uniref:hypothetical protein n=1 Tax=Streptomyces sp. NPDC059389 TaxID=3346818 RepID=UPI0036A3C77E